MQEEAQEQPQGPQKYKAIVDDRPDSSSHHVFVNPEVLDADLNEVMEDDIVLVVGKRHKMTACQISTYIFF